MNSTLMGHILAIDLRSGRLAYAVLDDAQLLDYGIARFKSASTARVRAAALLRAFRPARVVLRKVRLRSTRRRPHWETITRAICNEAKWFGTPIAWVTEFTLRKHFRQLGCRNKFQAAKLLGERFPGIARKVPRQRKSYEPEPWSVSYFDALSLGVAYLALHSGHDPISSRISKESFRRPPNDVAE